MAAIIRVVAPSELLLQSAAKEERSAETHKQNAIQLNPITEGKRRWWKLSARTASPKSAIIEVLVLIWFLALALTATIECFTELSRLLQRNAIERVAAR